MKSFIATVAVAVVVVLAGLMIAVSPADAAAASRLATSSSASGKIPDPNLHPILLSVDTAYGTDAVTLTAVDTTTGVRVATGSSAMPQPPIDYVEAPMAGVDPVARVYYVRVAGDNFTAVYGYSLDTMQLVVNCSVSATGFDDVGIVVGGSYLYLPRYGDVRRLDPTTCDLQLVFQVPNIEYALLDGAWAYDDATDMLWQHAERLGGYAVVLALDVRSTPAVLKLNTTVRYSVPWVANGFQRMIIAPDGMLLTLRPDSPDQAHNSTLWAVDPTAGPNSSAKPLALVDWKAYFGGSWDQPLLRNGKDGIIMFECPYVYHFDFNGQSQGINTIQGAPISCVADVFYALLPQSA